MILFGRCSSLKGTLAYHLERYVLEASSTGTNVSVQAELIRSTIAQNPHANVLIIACAGCPDLRMLFNELRAFRGQLWLNDNDKKALESSIGQIARVFPDDLIAIYKPRLH